MRSTIHVAVALLLALSGSEAAFGLISIEGKIGKRSGSWDSGSGDSVTGSGNETRFDVILDPIPLIPIGFGVAVASGKYGFAAEDGISDTTYIGVIPEIKAWLPLPITSLTPYLKVGYNVAGAYKGKVAGSVQGQATDVDMVFAAKGTHLAAGLSYKLIPTLALALEYSQTDETLSVNSAEILGMDVSSQFEDFKLKSSAVLVGIDFGI